MKYKIETINSGLRASVTINHLVIEEDFIINDTKYRIKGIGIRTKQQPVTKEWYYDLTKGYITCLQLNNKIDMRYISFKYFKIINNCQL